MVVVPGYYLVWYNKRDEPFPKGAVVVPGYYLVWYNISMPNSSLR